MGPPPRQKTDRDYNPPYNIMVSVKFPIYKVPGIFPSVDAILDIGSGIFSDRNRISNE